MIRGIHYTDVHLKEKNPPSRIGDYAQDILDKLRRVGDIARERSADFTTCGGDLFHEKEPKSTPHWLVSDTIGVLKSFGVPNYTIVGNHDIQYDREDTLENQPMGVLLRSGALIRQVDQVLGDSEGLRVQLHGFEFAEDPDWSALSLHDRSKADFHILSLHVYASRHGGHLHAQKLHSYADIAALGYDLVLLGHYHADQGTTAMAGPHGPCKLVNIGSISRGDYGDENLARVPKCCLFSVARDSSGAVSCTLEEISVNARPAAEVFDLEKKEEIRKQTAQTEEFVEELRMAAVEVGSPSGDCGVEDAISELGVSDADVLREVRGYLDQARAQLAEAKKR